MSHNHVLATRGPMTWWRCWVCGMSFMMWAPEDRQSDRIALGFSMGEAQRAHLRKFHPEAFDGMMSHVVESLGSDECIEPPQDPADLKKRRLEFRASIRRLFALLFADDPRDR